MALSSGMQQGEFIIAKPLTKKDAGMIIRRL
jgi:hypothetical protein